MSLKDETDTMNNNNPLYTKLRKKYRIKSKKSIFSFFFKINSKQKKFNRIPESFAKNFNQESYLQINPDVKKSIQEGKFENALEHFILYGYDEVKRGQRRIGTAFPFMTEEEYVEENPDVEDAVDSKAFSCGFEHFLHFGYQEFKNGTRKLVGDYPFEFSKELSEQLKKDFDTKKYLEANEEVKKLIKNKTVKSAWEHFQIEGYKKVRLGQQQLYSAIPRYSESEYVFNNGDIKKALEQGKLLSPYTHFLLYGVKEILAGDRTMKGIFVYQYKEPLFTKKIQSEIEDFSKKPLVSIIIPVYNVDKKWLDLAIASIQNQWYSKWEICIADDSSTNIETLNYLEILKSHEKVKIVSLPQNGNISKASNEALKLAKGTYIALMDNDDELTPDALYEVVKAINEKDAEFIYSDEDKLEMDGRYSDPHFKPDFAPDMFLSQNYMSHLGVIKKSLIEKVGGWEIGLEGSQDYDLYLKVLEHTSKVSHISKVLYHWRKVPGSTAAVFSDKSYAQNAGKVALENAIKRRDIDATVENGKYPGTYRVKYKMKGEPLVSIVIPFKDKPELLDMCIHSILKKSTYKHFEIIGMSNNSDEQKTFEMMKSFEKKDKRISFYEYNEPFNYSAINNYAVRHYAKGEHIILLNNDIEILSSQWIESMLEFSQREDVGAVGAKLYYPNDTIQHAGVTIGPLTLAGHNFRHLPRDTPGYMGRESVIQNISAITAACLMVKKDIYLSVNGLNEKELTIAFNDIDVCLRLQEEGYNNIYTPYCEAYHYESISRGAEDNPEKVKRFNKEVFFMQTRHRNILEKGDPYYNINLTLEHENFEIREKK